MDEWEEDTGEPIRRHVRRILEQLTAKKQKNDGDEASSTSDDAVEVEREEQVPPRVKDGEGPS